MSLETPTPSWTIGRVLVWSTEFLQGRGLADSPRLDAELLLAFALGMRRIQLYTHFDQPLTVAEREPFKNFLKRRGAGEPVAYITGEKEFMGFAFQVGPSVLIPRPDTEVLVEAAIAWGKTRGDAPLRILDVGTGSGCIAVSLALKLPQAQVSAWDVDREALVTARANAAALGAQVAFAEADALSDEAWEDASDGERFDAVVSNPPYISPDEEPSLPYSVLGYEPRRALFAAPDGLGFYQALAAQAPRRLVAGGRLMVEIGSGQGASVAAILQNSGWADVTVLKDYAKLDRVVTAVWQSGASR